MAWSAAARKAAAEARKLHSVAKMMYKNKAKGFKTSIEFQTEYGALHADRKQLARDIKAIRAGTKRYDNIVGGHALNVRNMMYNVAASTGSRNYLKKTGAKRIIPTDGRGEALAGYLRAQRLAGINWRGK